MAARNQSSRVFTTAPFEGVVQPGTWLAALLYRVSNPRKQRWNAFYRACKQIPASSPVHGVTSFDRLNERRLALIDKRRSGGGRNATEEIEFKALQKVITQRLCGPTVVTNFILQRSLRRLRATRRR